MAFLSLPGGLGHRNESTTWAQPQLPHLKSWEISPHIAPKGQPEKACTVFSTQKILTMIITRSLPFELGLTGPISAGKMTVTYSGGLWAL